MEIKLTSASFLFRKRLLMIIMRTFIFLFCATVFALTPDNVISQNSKIKIEEDKTLTVDEVFDLIMNQTDYKFFYEEGIFKNFPNVQVKKGIISTSKLLKRSLSNGSLDITVTANNAILIKEKLPDTIEVPQQHQISGTVTDQSGQPLPGANIVEKGTSNGVQSNFDGKFSLEVADESAVLVVSYIGFTTQEVAVNGNASLTIALKEDAANLDEVVVVGYGTLNKKNVTGAVSSLNSDSFKNIPITSVEQGIASQMPGVEVSQNSGQPGEGNTINIRGISTITAGAKPLIVLDGLPLSEETPLNTINPNDIESVQVLKDAASASIYGSRGANGVIIITTKKGTQGKPQFSFNSYVGFQQVAHKIDFMNAYEHAIWSRDARNNYYLQFNNGTFSENDDNATRQANASTLGFNPRKAIIPSFIQPYLTGQQGLTDTDWQDELFRNAKIENHQMSARGGNERTSYFVSGDFFSQEGVVKGSDYERLSFRINLETKLSNSLKLGLNVSPSFSKQNAIPTGFNTSPITALVMALPYFPAYNPDGSLAISQQTIAATEGDQARTESPLAMALLNKNQRNSKKLLGSAFLELDLIEGLKAKTYVGVDLSNDRSEIFNPSIVGTRNNPAPLNPKGSSAFSERLNWVIENTLAYDKVFNEKHNVNLLIGYTFQEETFNSNLVTATDFPNDFVETLNAGIVNGGNSLSSKSTLVSYLARARYDFDGKYLLTATIRRDGSSRFGANNRFGVFPSVSAGYRISDEPFFPDSAIINDLKIRASWGVAGNNQIQDFSSQALLNASNAVLNGGVQNGLAPSSSPNANLGWEETNTLNFGLDLGLLNNSISATLDYYIATTNDLLLQVPVPAHSGFTESLQNIGKIENKGIELAVKTNYNLGPVKVSTMFNIAANKNKVLELGPGQEEIITGRNITRIGGELGASYGYRVLGVFTSQQQIDNTPSLSSAQVGEYIYEDANEDGQINASDRVNLGSVHPDYTFGINSNFSYKGFDLGVVLQGVQGVHIHDRTVSVLLYNPEGWNNGTKDYFNNYYTPERGENAVYARPNTLPRDNGFYRETDLLQEDASFIRFRNITLGYTIPQDLANKLHVNSLRLYFSSKNPFTFTNYRGFNPEQRVNNALTPTTGFDNYPVDRSFVFGVNLNF